MNNFRAFVQVDDVVEDSMVSNYEEGNVNPQEKIDIEMGMKFAEDVPHPTLPEILRNIDCGDLEDNIVCKEVEVDDSAVMVTVEENVRGDPSADRSRVAEHEAKMWSESK
ncbi:hypothetical protein MLD38_020105 [Melastoma candidum]|nr:hypothetical protein MLD38_020105 [Melastoma candidum]